MLPTLLPVFFFLSQKSSQGDPFKTVTDYATQNPPILLRVNLMMIIIANRVLIIWSQSLIVLIPILTPPFAHDPPATQPSLLQVLGTY